MLPRVMGRDVSRGDRANSQKNPEIFFPVRRAFAATIEADSERRSILKPVQELLPDYVLGELPAEEQRELDALIAESPELRREVDRVTEALAATASHAAPVAPTPSLRARLLQTLGGVERFAP